jgi:hypothetical protein
VLFGLWLLFASSSAAAAEPLVVDPWRTETPPPAAAYEVLPLVEVIDPWAGAPLAAPRARPEIVDPWAAASDAVPTAVFPPLD